MLNHKVFGFASGNKLRLICDSKTSRIMIFAANLMRTSDGNSLSTQNVEFRIQNEDFPALPGANHLENRQAHVRPTYFFPLKFFTILKFSSS